jgi:outer membrane protein assembly factor BamB
MRLLLIASVCLIVMACTPPSPTLFIPQTSRIQQADSLQSLKAIRWKFKTDGAIRGNVLLTPDLALVGSADGCLYALNRNTAKLHWKFKTGGSITSTPLVVDGQVFISSRDQVLYAIDLKSGAGRWRFGMKDLLPHNWGWEYFQSTPVYHDGNIIIGSGDGNLYALNSEDGTVQWSFQTKGRIRSTPVVYGDEILVTGFDGFLHGIDAATGTPRWSFATEGTKLKAEDFGWDRLSIDATPVIEKDMAIFGSRDGYLYCLDLKTHVLKWKQTYGPTWCIASALVHDNRVFVGWSDNFLFSAFDLDTGKELWHHTCGNNIYSSAVIAGKNVLVGSADNTLYAFDYKTGETAWSFKTQSSIYASPVVDGDQVYVGSDDGILYALEGGAAASARKAIVYTNDRDNPYLRGDEKITAYLKSHGIESADSAALRKFMQARVGDDAPGVVVVNHSSVPPNVWKNDSLPSAFRNFMEQGGTVIWLGAAPNVVQFDAKGNYLGEFPEIPSHMLDFDFDLVHDSGEYTCWATESGKRYGMPDHWIGNYSVNPAGVDLVLAYNEYNRATCWIKKIGKGRFIQARTWSDEVSQENLTALHNLIQVNFD